MLLGVLRVHDAVQRTADRVERGSPRLRLSAPAQAKAMRQHQDFIHAAPRQIAACVPMRPARRPACCRRRDASGAS